MDIIYNTIYRYRVYNIDTYNIAYNNIYRELVLRSYIKTDIGVPGPTLNCF